MTIGQYQRTKQPTPIIGKMADNWPILITGASLDSSKFPHSVCEMAELGLLCQTDSRKI